MELGRYVERLRAEFAAMSATAGPEVRDVAERLVTPLESAARLVLLDVLAAAAEEITLDLAPGSVHLRLRESAPDFVVTPPDDGSTHREEPAARAPTVMAPSEAPLIGAEPEGGTVARINFRPTEALKTRIEEAAAHEGLSVNAWLARVTATALDQAPSRPSGRSGGRGGWFG